MADRQGSRVGRLTPDDRVSKRCDFGVWRAPSHRTTPRRATPAICAGMRNGVERAPTTLFFRRAARRPTKVPCEQSRRLPNIEYVLAGRNGDDARAARLSTMWWASKANPITLVRAMVEAVHTSTPLWLPGLRVARLDLKRTRTAFR